MIDFVVVLIGADGGGALSVFRLIRIFRCLGRSVAPEPDSLTWTLTPRIIRVIGFVERLNMLVQAFAVALQSVLWVGVNPNRNRPCGSEAWLLAGALFDGYLHLFDPFEQYVRGL